MDDLGYDYRDDQGQIRWLECQSNWYGLQVCVPHSPFSPVISHNKLAHMASQDAGKVWYLAFKHWLLAEMCFVQSEIDPCLFYIYKGTSDF